MTVDTEIRLRGKAAKEFHDMMTSVDLESIKARDVFISGVNEKNDEMGILTIDISDLDIDFSILDDASEKIESVPVVKNEIYVGSVQVCYSPLEASDITVCNEEKSSYTMNGYYASAEVYSVNPSVSIQYAA